MFFPNQFHNWFYIHFMFFYFILGGKDFTDEVWKTSERTWSPLVSRGASGTVEVPLSRVKPVT